MISGKKISWVCVRMNGNGENSLVLLQEARTLLWFLREEMDGLDRIGRWRSIKRRLGFKKMSCCGASWGFRPSTMTVREDDNDDDDGVQAQAQAQAQSMAQAQEEVGQASPGISPDRGCVGEAPVSPRMNLATALAAERQMRAAQDVATVAVGPTNGGTSEGAPGTPLRVSLLRLLEESDGGDGEMEKERGAGSDQLCCVCMGRKKGAAFIPCGHTFCRVCSRELWLNRGSCPLCNRSILEILDIF